MKNRLKTTWTHPRSQHRHLLDCYHPPTGEPGCSFHSSYAWELNAGQPPHGQIQALPEHLSLSSQDSRTQETQLCSTIKILPPEMTFRVFLQACLTRFLRWSLTGLFWVMPSIGLPWTCSATVKKNHQDWFDSQRRHTTVTPTNHPISWCVTSF